jgi:AcrR family transcriptional regulator
VTPRRSGLRETKKQATQKALREAALRLAMERGPENVRVDDIAEAAGVSARTYNNYFSSREQAIVAAVTAEREARVAKAVAAEAPDERLAAAVVEAVVEAYTDPGGDDHAAFLLIVTAPSLRNAFLDESTAGIEPPLTAALVERFGVTERHTAQVLSASVAAAVRIALERWLQPAATSATTGALVVPTGSLPDLLRRSLAPLEPALDAAESIHRGGVS